MENLKTSKGKPVISGKFYELKYKWGDSYRYGYGWLNPEKKHGDNQANNHHEKDIKPGYASAF
jgi:hypothetical protein